MGPAGAALFASVGTAAEVPADAMENFTDTFPGTSLDSGKWSTSGYTGGVTVTGNQAQIPCRSDYASGMASVASNWDLTNSVAAWRKGFTSYRSSQNGAITLQIDSNNRIRFQMDDGLLKAEYRNNSGTTVTLRNDTSYSAATHVYFRIRESGGTIYWDWSTNGTSWTNYTSTTAITFNITDLRVLATAGDYNGTNGSFNLSEWNQTPYQV